MAKRYLPFHFRMIVCLSILLLVLNGCKDTGATHEAGKLENCRILIDNKEWNSAIDTCGQVKTDEGYHLTAQAYMGRGGITLFEMLSTLAEDNVDTSSVMFSYIPDSTSDEADYRSALQNLLTNIKTKNQTVYLESLILSGLLVFKELKTLLTLSVTDNVWTTCAGTTNSTMDVRNCSWGPQFPDSASANSGDQIIFGGLGSSLYINICGENSHDVSFDNTQTTDVNGFMLNRETTVDSCTIGTGSVLDYNRTAYTNYTGGSKSDLEPLYYYGKFDTGQNFTVSSDTAPPLSFCDAAYIALPDASDDKISDCEMLNFLMNPAF